MANPLETGLNWGTKVADGDSFIFYYFYEYAEETPFGEVSSGFTEYEVAQFEQAFAVYSTFLDLHFIEVDQSAQADYNLLTYASASSTLGMMFPPGVTEHAGFGYFNYAGSGWDWTAPGTGGLEQGGFGFVTIIHELGHGLGLAHPHDEGGSSTVFPGVSGAFNDYGDFALNQGVYTTMSYNAGWRTNPDGLPPSVNFGYQGTPMAIDIAVLQAKYGVNTAHNVGDTTYYLPTTNGTGTFYSCIWDAGGTDTIAATGGGPALIDLRAATLKLEPGGGGFLSYVDDVYGGFTIAHGVVIENATGGAGDDYLRGNSVANKIKGRSGDDMLFGGSGRDTLLGKKGADELDGGKGKDVLTGGASDDILNGGGGRDSFEFKGRLKTLGVDTVDDFKAGKDQILLSKKAFKGIGSKGDLKAGKFTVGDDAKDGKDRIVYDDDSGNLSFARHGDNGGLKKFAKLDAGLSLDHHDFVVVA